MTRVFIGGSRKITRLSPAVQKRLDRVIEKGLEIVIGDANGADKAVQRYLRDRGYRNVRVFCSNGICRNNAGGWKTEPVKVTGGERGFGFYAAKDQAMAKEATVGLMLWDGVSRGTLANVRRLLQDNKKVVVYVSPLRDFFTLRGAADLETLLSRSIRRRRAAPKSGSHGHAAPRQRTHALGF